MSDISFISNQYNSLFKTTENLNRSVITLKKWNIINSERGKEFKSLTVSIEELRISRNEWSDFLTFLLTGMETHEQNLGILPKNAIKDFQKTILLIIPDFTEEIRNINQLILDEMDLDSKQLAVLDEIVSALNNERAILFSQLRTSR